MKGKHQKEVPLAIELQRNSALIQARLTARANNERRKIQDRLNAINLQLEKGRIIAWQKEVGQYSFPCRLIGLFYGEYAPHMIVEYQLTSGAKTIDYWPMTKEDESRVFAPAQTEEKIEVSA